MKAKDSASPLVKAMAFRRHDVPLCADHGFFSSELESKQR